MFCGWAVDYVAFPKKTSGRNVIHRGPIPGSGYCGQLPKIWIGRRRDKCLYVFQATQVLPQVHVIDGPHSRKLHK